MTALKSSYEIAVEKTKKMGIGDNLALSEEQKQKIAAIRQEFEAKVAEKKILLEDQPELPEEIRKLERKRDERIEAFYREVRQNRS